MCDSDRLGVSSGAGGMQHYERLIPSGFKGLVVAIMFNLRGVQEVILIRDGSNIHGIFSENMVDIHTSWKKPLLAICRLENCDMICRAVTAGAEEYLWTYEYEHNFHTEQKFPDLVASFESSSKENEVTEISCWPLAAPFTKPA